MRESRTLPLYLGALAALPPLGIDMGLPALPMLQNDLRATAGEAGMTLSLFLFGFAVAPILLGPVADRFGRKPTLLAGLLFFTIAGIAAAVSASVFSILASRLVQGIGAGACAVLPMVIIRDLFEGATARHHMANVTAIQGFAPALAPIAGTLLLVVGRWNTIFFALAIAGLLLLLTTVFWFRESAQTRSTTLHPRNLAVGYWNVLKNPVCLGFSLVQAFSFACMFSYVSGAPLVIMGTYHLSAGVFSMLFAITAVCIIAGSMVIGRIGKYAPVSKSLPVALMLLGVSSLAATGLSYTGLSSLTLLMIMFASSTFSFGLIAPMAWHEALSPLPNSAGLVSAVVGSMQMLFGAGASALVTAFFDGSAKSLTTTMLAASIGAAIAGSFALRASRSGITQGAHAA